MKKINHGEKQTDVKWEKTGGGKRKTSRLKVPNMKKAAQPQGENCED